MFQSELLDKINKMKVCIIGDEIKYNKHSMIIIGGVPQSYILCDIMESLQRT